MYLTSGFAMYNTGEYLMITFTVRESLFSDLNAIMSAPSRMWVRNTY